jgi:hypothetical protein
MIHFSPLYFYVKPGGTPMLWLNLTMSPLLYFLQNCCVTEKDIFLSDFPEA